MSKYKWKKLFTVERAGHRFWLDENSGRVSIADDSSDGKNPEHTDDSVLFIDTSCPIVIGERGHFFVTVVKSDGAYSCVVALMPRGAWWLVVNLGMRFRLSGIDLTPVPTAAYMKMYERMRCQALEKYHKEVEAGVHASV